jgi:peptidoglycan hydrolase CwlO-like protein
MPTLAAAHALGLNEDDAKPKSAKGFLALQQVTASCHAIRNTNITAPAPKPDWFQGLSDNLDTTKAHAAEWINTLGPKVSSTIPRAILTYSDSFIRTAEMIQKLLNKPNPTDSDVKTSLQLFERLLGDVDTIKKNFERASDDMTKWGDKLTADRKKLADGASAVQSALANDAQRIAKLRAEIESLQSEISFEKKQLIASVISLTAGILITIVGIFLTMATGPVGAFVLGAGLATVVGGGAGTTIWAVKIKAAEEKILSDQSEIDATQQQITALTALSTSVQSVMTDISTATQYLADVKTLWGTMEHLLNTLCENLKAPNANLSSVLNLQSINESSQNWADLKGFAETLITPQVQKPQIVLLTKHAS